MITESTVVQKIRRIAMSEKTRFLTGESCKETAQYAWDGYVDGSFSPFPTYKEQKIILESNEIFPAIVSCEKKAYWKYLFHYDKPNANQTETL